MKRKLKAMFLVVEFNLLFWLALMGGALAPGHASETSSWWEIKVPVNRMLLFVGVGFAAIMQHWAYHAVYREAQRLDSGPETTPRP